MPEVSAKGFLGKVLLLLAPAFALWYWLAPVVIFPVALLLRLALLTFYPEAFADVEQQGYHVDIVTRFSASLVAGAQQPPGQDTVLVFTLNALKYGYGLPLLLALMLAAPGPLGGRLVKFLIGALILIPVQVWGVYFESLIRLGQFIPVIIPQLAATEFARNSIALAYQLGYLILPAVTPVIIWGMFNLDFIRRLAPGLVQRPG
jgi:hypothetical protein